MYRTVIQNLLKALQEIEAPHYLTANVKMVDDICNVFNDHFTTYENNFTSQLSTNYSVLVKTGKINDRQHFLKQLQIPKHYVFSEDRDAEVVSTLEKIKDIRGNHENELSQLLTIPDFIIHKDQENSEMKNQLLIVEVKTEANLSYAKFAWDFFKLNLYLNKFNFQTACFIVVNNTEDKVGSYVSKYITDKLYRAERTKDLFVIAKESYNHRPHIASLNRFLVNYIKNYKR
jgi:hypothetical protein